MTEVERCELEARSARQRLERDLDVLRSPATVETLKQTIADEASRMKDSVLEDVTARARSTVTSLVEDIKGRATANPSAAVAIAAGVALHLIRRPPITAALISLGLYSLFRTRPVTDSGLSQAKENFAKQVSKVASSTQEAAMDLNDVVSEKVKDLTEAGMQKAASLATSLGSQTETVAGTARRSVHDAADMMAAVKKQASASAGQTVRTTAAFAQENRDALLLGLAGIAVSAALGISVQRRLAD